MDTTEAEWASAMPALSASRGHQERSAQNGASDGIEPVRRNVFRARKEIRHRIVDQPVQRAAIFPNRRQHRVDRLCEA
jgi:hypothetical protein